MGDVVTIPLIGALVGLIGLLVAVLNIREQPVVKAVLIILIVFILAFFGWYIAPAVKLNALMKDRQKLFQDDKKTTDSAIQDEVKQIEEAQRRKEKAEREAQAFASEQKEAEAKRAKEIAAQAAMVEEQHRISLQQAENNSIEHVQRAILGTWNCSYAADLTFKSDGTVTPSIGFGETYKIIDSTRINITTYYGHGLTFEYALDLNGPVQTLKNGILAINCTKPRL